MKNAIESLAFGNVKRATEIKQKPIIRENTILLNMILGHLHAKKELSTFNDPFDMCSKTLTKYKKQAQILYLTGIKSILKYEAKNTKKLIENINSLPEQFRPTTNNFDRENLPISFIEVEIYMIKQALNKLNLERDNKMCFSAKALTLTEVIYMISAIVELYTRVHKKKESLRNFLLRNTNQEFLFQFDLAYEHLDVEHLTNKEGNVSRKHLYTIKSLTMAVFNIQKSHYTDNDLDLDIAEFELTNPFNMDRLISTILIAPTYS